MFEVFVIDDCHQRQRVVLRIRPEIHGFKRRLLLGDYREFDPGTVRNTLPSVSDRRGDAAMPAKRIDSQPAPIYGGCRFVKAVH